MRGDDAQLKTKSLFFGDEEDVGALADELEGGGSRDNGCETPDTEEAKSISPGGTSRSPRGQGHIQMEYEEEEDEDDDIIEDIGVPSNFEP